MQTKQYTAATAWPTFFKTLSEKGREGERDNGARKPMRWGAEPRQETRR